jgi:hypothetical protein
MAAVNQQAAGVGRQPPVLEARDHAARRGNPETDGLVSLGDRGDADCDLLAEEPVT